jgi:hypothetical protein
MNNSPLTPVEIMELGEILQLVADWLHQDPIVLNQSLLRFIGHPAYDLEELHADLDRYAFLLGANDGENRLEP